MRENHYGMSTDVFLQAARALLPEMVRIRRHLHRHPEELFREFETTRFTIGYLEELGIPCRRLEPTGLVAEIKGPEAGPCVALRTDMDALRIQEETGLSFTSENEGFMHACGHDGHMAMVLGAARLLREAGLPKCGSVRLLFQPAEEQGLGAPEVIRQGGLEGVDALFGLHLFTGFPTGTLYLKEGPVMAASALFSIKIHGRGGHGSSPHQGVDALYAGASLVQNLQSLVSRELDARKPAVVSVCSFHSGTRPNILAQEAELSGTCRTFDAYIHEILPHAIDRILQGTAAALRVKAELDYRECCPVVDNDEGLTRLAREAAQAAGLRIEEAEPMMISEDFGFYRAHVPSAFAFLGAGEGYPNHHPAFDLDESALAQGAAYLAACADRLLR